MGLFGGNYDKPGKGIDKNEPKKKPFFLFFEIFFRKIWKMSQISMLYTLCCIPYFLLLFAFAPVGQEYVENLAGSPIASGAGATLYITLKSLLAMAVIVFWGAGPLTAGYTTVMRNYAREEHSFVMTDFFGKAKENFKQSMIVLVADILLLSLGMFAYVFYDAQYIATNSMVWLIAKYIIVFIFIVYTLMHQYVYQVMITFNVSVKELFVNSFMLAFAKLPMNILILLISAALLFLMFTTYLNVFIALLLYIVILMSFNTFINIFYTTKTVDKIINSGSMNLNK